MNFQVYDQLVEKTKSTPGARVENHKFCASVHFRCVEEKVYIYYILIIILKQLIFDIIF
jgi:trehalose 6-phosphate phosphatase